MGTFGVVFDLDGVLVDSADAHRRSWRALADERGRRVSEERFDATFGRKNDDIVPLLFGPTGEVEARQLADRKEEIYRDFVRECPPIVAGAVELVQALRDAGVRLAVGSSAPRENIDLMLSAMKVHGWFGAIISAEDVTRGKPDPQVFELACAGLRLPRGRCVVIEDAPAGVLAAKAAGARCVAVLRHHPRESFHRPDEVVARLDELSVDRLRRLVDGT